MNILNKSFIMIIISYQLIIGQTFLYAGSMEDGVVDQQRTVDQIDDLMKTADPSDIPFIDYLEDFSIDHTQPIKEYDLSEYNGKKIYIGYGIYDGDEKYCKFVEMPTPPSTSIDAAFDDVKVFNNRSYAISKSRMGYDSCESLTASYGGIVAAPTNSGENSFMGSYGKDKWLGVFRPSCSDDYVNTEGRDQDYFNWSKSEDTAMCDSGLLNTYQNKYTWSKVSSSDSHYCLMEVNSPHIERPIKVCAPWWRIERKYTKPRNLEVGGINLGTINQADIPELYNVCSVLNEEGSAVAEDHTTEEITCTTYYDATVAEGCVDDIYQKICYVNECKGYVENACFHKDTLIPLKDYTKMTIMKAGTPTQIKGKAKIRTQIFECPISTPGSETCLEKSTVIAYPQECPGSQCNDLKVCYSEAIDSDARIECKATYPCEKLYPTLDITPTYEDGEIKYLHNHCSDGSTLDFPINIQNKLNKTCVEYSRITKTDEIVKNCLLERTYTDYSVDMSLTGVDVYENNPSCVRMNNLVESRPLKEVLFEVKYHSSAFPTISKALVDGSKELVFVPDDATDIYSVGGAGLSVVMQEDQDGTTSVDDQSANCPFSDEWKQYLKNMLDGSSPTQKYTGGSNIEITATYSSISDCNDYADSLGGSGSLSGTTCTVTKSATDEDKLFKQIKKSGSGGEPGDEYPLGNFTSYSNSVEVDTCDEWSRCLSAKVKSNTSGGPVTCVFEQDGDYATEPADPQLDDMGTASDCKPISNKESSKDSSFDGLKDIFFIEDVVTGAFGYTSNYLIHPYQDNLVTIDGKEAFPFEVTPIIQDPLSYNAKIHQTSILAKNINPKVAAMGGAGIAVAGASAAEMLGTLIITMPEFAVIVIVIVVLVLLFQDNTKYNEESIYWILYKDIPKAEYIDNVYGYDGRLKTDLGTKWRMVYALSGEDPGTNLHSDFRNFTGTLEVPDFKIMLDNLFEMKTQNFACLGFEIGPGVPPSHPMERGVVVGYPKCKWYKVNCHKENDDVAEDDKIVSKRMNGYYLGAVNSMSIIVPYIGDYEVKVFDKNDELLGEITILEDDFLTETTSELANAQLNFGLNMSLADFIQEGQKEKACREEYMVEWGGGVSGIYAENQETANNANCQKSNDQYIKDHSAVKLKIRSTSVDDWFTIELSKPMPYANRIRLVSLSNKETREYRCYDPFGECDEEDFTIQEGE